MVLYRVYNDICKTLTPFRIMVSLVTYYLRNMMSTSFRTGALISVGLIMGGAIGKLLIVSFMV